MQDQAPTSYPSLRSGCSGGEPWIVSSLLMAAQHRNQTNYITWAQINIHIANEFQHCDGHKHPHSEWTSTYIAMYNNAHNSSESYNKRRIAMHTTTAISACRYVTRCVIISCVICRSVSLSLCVIHFVWFVIHMANEIQHCDGHKHPHSEWISTYIAMYNHAHNSSESYNSRRI